MCYSQFLCFTTKAQRKTPKYSQVSLEMNKLIQKSFNRNIDSKKKYSLDFNLNRESRAMCIMVISSYCMHQGVCFVHVLRAFLSTFQQYKSISALMFVIIYYEMLYAKLPSINTHVCIIPFLKPKKAQRLHYPKS